MPLQVTSVGVLYNGSTANGIVSWRTDNCGGRSHQVEEHKFRAMAADQPATGPRWAVVASAFTGQILTALIYIYIYIPEHDRHLYT